ncbi:hypothetical protein TNCV_2083361 [Trichonephila clavipes]|nr:hypothetical protein TNCV_2083361 [Trichonephila clavipes]
MWVCGLDVKREIGMARKRAENREGSLGFPGFVKPMFTKDKDRRRVRLSFSVANEENFQPLPARKLRDPAAKITSMAPNIFPMMFSYTYSTCILYGFQTASDITSIKESETLYQRRNKFPEMTIQSLNIQ